MLAVILSAIVSLGVAYFAVSVILREFGNRGAEIAAALSFSERAFSGGDIRPAATLRAQLAPVRVQSRPARRAAA